ncbi:MAG: hypothetical protein Q7U82_16575 [Gammaproteobacteria bacterium]|nr:hypothetical protein [Gammaproteobacteria bacterium]
MPGVVKGSKQQHMVVVPHRPWLRYALLAGVLTAAALGFGFGYLDAADEFATTSADNQQMALELADARDELQGLRSQVVISDRTSIMDQRANEEVQETINSLRQRIMQLEQDVMFYRQVMTPELAEPGLIIAEFTVQPTDLPDTYRYRAVFRQAGAGDRELKGKVQIDVAGTRAGEKVLLPLQELVSGAETVNTVLNFRYFQNIEGELVVPADFLPTQVEIRAESMEPQQRKLEKLFNWTVAEG